MNSLEPIPNLRARVKCIQLANRSTSIELAADHDELYFVNQFNRK